MTRKNKLDQITPHPGSPGGKLDALEPHDTITGDPESIISIDWSRHWNGQEQSKGEKAIQEALNEADSPDAEFLEHDEAVSRLKKRIPK